MTYKTKKKLVAEGRRSWVISKIEKEDDKNPDVEFKVYSEEKK